MKKLRYIAVENENSLVFYQAKETNVKVYAVNRHGFFFIIDELDGKVVKISRPEFANDFGYNMDELNAIVRSRGRVKISNSKTDFGTEQEEIIVEEPVIEVGIKTVEVDLSKKVEEQEEEIKKLKEINAELVDAVEKLINAEEK